MAHLCVLCRCAGQWRGAVLLSVHLADSHVPISILVISVLLHSTCIITVIVTCAAVVLIPTVPVTVSRIVITGVTFTVDKEIVSTVST